MSNLVSEQNLILLTFNLLVICVINFSNFHEGFKEKKELHVDIQAL